MMLSKNVSGVRVSSRDLLTAYKDWGLAPLLSETLRRAMNLQLAVWFWRLNDKQRGANYEPIKLSVNPWIKLQSPRGEHLPKTA